MKSPLYLYSTGTTSSAVALQTSWKVLIRLQLNAVRLTPELHFFPRWDHFVFVQIPLIAEFCQLIYHQTSFLALTIEINYHALCGSCCLVIHVWEIHCIRHLCRDRLSHMLLKTSILLSCDWNNLYEGLVSISVRKITCSAEQEEVIFLATSILRPSHDNSSYQELFPVSGRTIASMAEQYERFYQL